MNAPCEMKAGCRKGRCGHRWLMVLALGVHSLLGTHAHAQETAEAAAETDGEGAVLTRYLDALSQQRLIARETGSADRMEALARRGEALYFEQRFDEAALLLYEVVESPRFEDFRGLDAFAGAELLLAGCLAELGSLRSAARYLARILERGQEDPYFGPAYRRFVDVALESGSIPSHIEMLVATAGEDLPEDAENELRYLRGRAARDGGDPAEAESAFAAITQRSRFYANAQYLRGVMSAQRGDLDEAEARFCSIASTDDQRRTTFYVDERYYRIKDLAWLGLGRVAHEGRRASDAFYYYFQVPSDSERVAEALFEAAYSMYEGEDHDTAIDLLDQLEARFPASPFVDEALLLRGYVHLGRCEFEEARQLFEGYRTRFRPVLEEIDTVLASEVRQGRLYEELLRLDQERTSSEELSPEEVTEAARRQLETTPGMLLALLRVRPRFYEVHTQIRTLDAEAARAGRLAADLRGLAGRVRSERPQAAAAEEAFESEVAELRRMMRGARQTLEGLAHQLDSLRRADGEAAEIASLEESMARHGETLRALVRRLREAERAYGEGAAPASATTATDIQGLLAADARTARQLPGRVAAMRQRLVHVAGEAAVHSLRDLRERLASSLRRARIGQIDALTGSKRRIEVQIESLAAGRFPAELVDPLRVQGLLRDDEEYWPFEGELWEDEFEETVSSADSDEEGDE